MCYLFFLYLELVFTVYGIYLYMPVDTVGK